MKERLQVAWIVKAWATGGAERMILDLMPHLADTVDLVPIAALAEPADLMPALQRAGMQPRVLGGPSWPARLRAFVDRDRPAIVHLHGPFVGGLGRLALYGAPVAVVHTEHSIWSSHRFGARHLNAATFARNDGVAAVSDAVAEEILRSRLGARTRDRLRVVRNGIDAQVARRDAERGDSLPRELRSPSYVCVGHLRARKGIDVLLDAAPLIALAFPQARGFVVGEGEDAASLHAHQQRVAAGTVNLLGRRDDARAITGHADVFVVPSRVEGMPLALLEAMALERPIVATRVGSLPKFLTHERDALLVPPDDPRALADAIVQLLQAPDRAQALGRAARRTVEREANVTVTAAEYLALYDAAVVRRAGTRRTTLRELARRACRTA
jgi:glycosyltransferase involved in cell wall biosynthesis